MARIILGVIAAYAAWTLIWLGGNALFFAEAAEVVGQGERYDKAGPLAGALGLSVACSLIAGVIAALVGGRNAKPAAIITAVALLLTGIGVQASAWSLMPVWYHLAFLLLLCPMTMIGWAIAGAASNK